MVFYLWCLREIWICLCFIRSNHILVAQNGRFLTKSLYLEGSNMVSTRGKILDFKLSEIPKNKLFRTFYSLRLSLKSWIFHFFRENFPEYPRDITLWIFILVYSVPQHFWCFKNNKLYWSAKSFLALSFVCTKTSCDLVGMDLLLVIRW